MATTVDIAIKPGGGGDYTSMAACADDLVGYDLVSADEILHIQGYDGLDDSAYAYFRTLTTDATRYLIIEAAAGHRGSYIYSKSGGAFTGGGYYLNVDNDAALLIEAAYTRVRNLRIRQNANGGYPSCLYITANNCQAENVYAVSDGTATETYAIQVNNATTTTFKMANCAGLSLASGGQHGFRWLNSSAGRTLYANNCGFFASNLRGFQMTGSGVALLKNCMAHGSPSYQDYHLGAALDAASTHNAWFQAAAPGSGVNWQDYSAWAGLSNSTIPVANFTGLVIDAVNGDYRLDPTTGPSADGTDLSADPNFPVTTDITGAARNGVYYLGAFGTGPADRAGPTTSTARRARRRRFFHLRRMQGRGTN